MARALRALAMVAVAAAVMAVPPANARPWTPGMRAAIRYATHRRGIISFAVCTRKRCWDWRATRTYPSASLLKSMLLVAYLNRASVRGRPLTGSERALLGPMITRSDNTDATAVLGIVGAGGLNDVA